MTRITWTSPYGGRRYEATLPMRGRLEVVKQNTAAGGPRWRATFTDATGARWSAGKGQYLAPVKREAEEYAHGRVPAGYRFHSEQAAERAGRADMAACEANSQ